ncbi:hypothetical protein F4802DRAFT_603382 [Xylaria palmicola]|nr:hypothetical protein F4802DRAFT_603382 [Xylaria palmicola]
MPSKMHRNAATNSAIPGPSPTSSEYSPTGSITSPKASKAHYKAMRKHKPTSSKSSSNRKVQLNKYNLSDETSDSSEDSKSDAESEHQAQRHDVRPSLKGLTFRKSPRENLLERRLAKLKQDNTELRRQLRAEEINDKTEKDELIALLQNDNIRFKYQIQQQNTIVARIANKISKAFQEYEETVSRINPVNKSERDSPTRSIVDIPSYLRYDSNSES